MPVETATSLATLNPAYPYDGDPEAQGAAHLRLIKSIVQGSFPALGGNVTATAIALNAAAALQPSGPGNLIVPPQTIVDPLSGGSVALVGGASKGNWGITNYNGSLTFQATNDAKTALTAARAVIDASGNLSVTGTLFASGSLVVGQGQTVYAGTTPLSFVGEIRMFAGPYAGIPGGWGLCDGTSGTPDLRDRFLVGAGLSYPVGGVGGTVLNALSVAQMPSHSHVVDDPGHVHGVTDLGHTHFIADPGHAHSTSLPPAGPPAAPGGLTTQLSIQSPGTVSVSTTTSQTGVTAAISHANTSVQAAGVGVSLEYTGSGAAIENRPPFYALCFIMRIA